jgi:hypothetical protein
MKLADVRAQPTFKPWRSRKFWWASVALHLGTLGFLWWQNLGVALPKTATEMAQAQREEVADLHKRVQSVQRMQSEFEKRNAAAGKGAGQSSGKNARVAKDASAQDLQTQLRELVQSMEAQQLPERAKELAKLTGLNEKQALEKLKSEAANLDKLSPEQLQQRAQTALDRQREQAQKAQDGQAVASANASPPASARSAAASGVQTASNSAAKSTGPSGKGGAGNSAAQSASPGQAGARSAGSSGGSGGGGERFAGTAAPGGVRGAVQDFRDYSGSVAPPVLNAANLQLGAGRILGAGGSPANRMMVDNWHIIGPFAGHGEQAIDKVLPPELRVDLDAEYEGQNKRRVRWQAHQLPSYPLIPPNAAESAVFYGYTEIKTDRARDVWLHLGADDDAKLWVNGDLVWRSGAQSKPWYRTSHTALKQELRTQNLTEASVRVSLKAGVNRFQFKLYNGCCEMFFAMAISPT